MDKNRTSLVWVCSSPTPYNDYLASALNESGCLDFEVVYRKNHLKSYPWKFFLDKPFKNRQLSNWLGLDLMVFWKVLSSRNNVFLIGGWHPSFWPLILLLVVTSGRFIIWSDTPNDNQRRGLVFSTIRRLGLSWVFKYSRAILCTGKPCVEKFIRMGADHNKVWNYPVWVPVKQKRVIRPESRSDILRLVTVGRLAAIKGLHVFIEAASKVRSRRPSLKIHYRICGDGPLRAQLEEQIDALQLSDCMEIVGWLEHQEILNELANSDIYVHPAIWEPYGVSVIEAMAAGLPILGSDNTMAVIDRVVEGESGLIHRTEDSGMLAEQIVTLAENDRMRLEMAEGAHRTSLNFHVEKGVEQLLRLIREPNKE